MKSERTIIAIAAVTIDGKIARHGNHLTDWTTPEDKKFLRNFLDKSDVVIVGHSTYKTAETPLSKRNCIVFTRGVSSIERVGENLAFYNPEGLSIEAAFEPYRTIALIGGTETYSYFLERGLIDELYVTIEPVVFGNGLSMFASKNEKDSAFTLVDMQKLNENGTVLLHYKR